MSPAFRCYGLSRATSLNLTAGQTLDGECLDKNQMSTECLWSWSQRMLSGEIIIAFHAETDGDGFRIRNIAVWGGNGDPFLNHFFQ